MLKKVIEQESCYNLITGKNIEHCKSMSVTDDGDSRFPNAGDVHVLLPKSFDIGVYEGHCKKTPTITTH